MLVLSRPARTLRLALSIAIALAPFFAGGCSASQRSGIAVDCAAANPYEVRILEDYEDGSANFIGFTDSTPGAVQSVAVASIEDGGRCGSGRALVLFARGNRDWGGGFATSSSNWDGDARGFDGFSFWARSPGASTKGFTLFIDDRSTLAAGGVCVPFAGTAGSSTVSIDINGMITVTGPVPAANACGNSFFAVMFATERWQFYRVPFGSLAQAPWPNRSASGIDRSAILARAIRMPKESEIELWIDDFGLYREKALHGVE